MRPDGRKSRWDAPSQTLVTIYSILYSFLYRLSIHLFHHLDSRGGAIGIRSHHDIHTVKGLVAGHARQVDVLHTSHLLVGINGLDRGG